MSLAKTGFTSTTSENYIMDAAVAYCNVTYDEVGGFTGTLLGATSGGVTFTDERTYRDIEVDGANHVKVKGNKVLESANGTLIAKVKELTADNISKAMNITPRAAEADEGPEGYQVIQGKVKVEDTDYLENVAFYGQKSNGEDILIILDNALSVGGIEMATEDNNEVIVEMTFEAHADPATLSDGLLPWKIILPGAGA